MMAYSEDHIALAAEYALGTLDADERAQVETMMAVDKDFTAMVEAWQQKLGVLNQMVGSVEPRPEVWDRIKAATGLGEPQAPKMAAQMFLLEFPSIISRSMKTTLANTAHFSGFRHLFVLKMTALLWSKRCETAQLM